MRLQMTSNGTGQIGGIFYAININSIFINKLKS
jgi:hypothetical protein